MHVCMSRLLLILILLCTGLAVKIPRSNPTAIAPTNPPDTLTRDVCIIGGGSSGTYAAIQLQKMGKSVVLVEKEPRLGGNTRTYTDPATNVPVDWGVNILRPERVITEYLGYLGVPYTRRFPTGKMERVDFRTGERCDCAPTGNITEGLARYVDQLKNYPYPDVGYNLSYPVPSDLLLPFKHFMEKYDLHATAEVFGGSGRSMGNWIDYPTLYLLKAFNMPTVSLGRTGWLEVQNGNTSKIYEAAQKTLGNSVLLHSWITSVTRDSDAVYLVAQTPVGQKRIQARHLIVTVPPRPKLLDFMDLDLREVALFSRFQSSYLYPGLVKVNGLPENVSFLNKQADTLYHEPERPALYRLATSPVANLKRFEVESMEPVAEVTVRHLVLSGVERLRRLGFNISTPKIVALADHSPYVSFVSSEDIEGGFYDRLNGLQGYRKTYWTGAAFDVQNSAQIWRFTEALLHEHFPHNET